MTTKICRDDEPCEKCSRCIHRWATDRNRRRYGSENYPGREEATRIRGDLETAWLDV